MGAGHLFCTFLARRFSGNGRKIFRLALSQRVRERGRPTNNTDNVDTDKTHSTVLTPTPTLTTPTPTLISTPSPKPTHFWQATFPWTRKETNGQLVPLCSPFPFILFIFFILVVKKFLLNRHESLIERESRASALSVHLFQKRNKKRLRPSVSFRQLDKEKREAITTSDLRQAIPKSDTILFRRSIHRERERQSNSIFPFPEFWQTIHPKRFPFIHFFANTGNTDTDKNQSICILDKQHHHHHWHNSDKRFRQVTTTAPHQPPTRDRESRKSALIGRRNSYNNSAPSAPHEHNGYTSDSFFRGTRLLDNREKERNRVILILYNRIPRYKRWYDISPSSVLPLLTRETSAPNKWLIGYDTIGYSDTRVDMISNRRQESVSYASLCSPPLLPHKQTPIGPQQAKRLQHSFIQRFHSVLWLWQTIPKTDSKDWFGERDRVRETEQ